MENQSDFETIDTVQYELHPTFKVILWMIIKRNTNLYLIQLVKR